MYCFWNQGWYLTHLPSHLFGRWTHSSSPPSLAAPTDQIITKNDANPAINISLALSNFLSALKSLFVHKTRIKLGYISGFTCFSPHTAAKATYKLLPLWRNALRDLDQLEREQWQVLDQWNSQKGQTVTKRSRVMSIKKLKSKNKSRKQQQEQDLYNDLFSTQSLRDENFTEILSCYFVFGFLFAGKKV